MRSRVVLGMCLLAVVAVSAHPSRARAAWAPEGVPLTQNSDDEAFPTLTTDGQGGAFIAWQGYGRIFAQRLTASGDVAPEWPSATGLEICASAPSGAYGQCGERVVSDGQGGAFVLWHDD